MRTRFRPLIALGAVLALLGSLLPGPLSAQATINTTTLAAALSAPSGSPSTVSLASGSTVAVGQILYVDREAMQVTATTATATIFVVTRGVQGTAAAAHISGAVVYSGPPNYFNASSSGIEVSGACTASAQPATPYIYLQSGSIYVCASGTWKVFRRGGFADATFFGVGTTYTASGAIAVEPGVVTLNAGSALAMTLVDPTTAQNGMIMVIRSATAQAHTVTYTAGFNGGTTTRDVATYSVIGSTLVIIAIAGNWCVLSTATVTIA